MSEWGGLLFGRVFRYALTLAARLCRAAIALVVAGALAARHHSAVVISQPLVVLLRRQNALQFGAIGRIGFVEMCLTLLGGERCVVAYRVHSLGTLSVQIVNGAFLHVGQSQRFGHLVGFAFDHHFVMVGTFVGIVFVSRSRAESERCDRNQQQVKRRCHKSVVLI